MVPKPIAAAIAIYLLVLKQPAAQLPSRLTDAEFWTLSQSLSESGDALISRYRDATLVSNETGFQRVLPLDPPPGQAGNAYLGVGPEQNFSYIAELQPAVAFILDIRRENRDLHLLYKALFELSEDRASFLSLQFSRPRPKNLDAQSDLAAIFTAYRQIPPDQAVHESNLRRIRHHLTVTRSLQLSEPELDGIASIYEAFRRFGPEISFDSKTNEQLGMRPPTRARYVDLMLATDRNGQQASFLSSEERFQRVRRLQQQNLIVPVVGNFAGPTALRGVGTWLRDRGSVVSMFYISNVRAYLRGIQKDFCDNVRALPAVEDSRFITTGAVATDSQTLTWPRGSAELQGPTGQKELVWFLTFADGTRRQVTENEYRQFFPDLLAISTVGKLSELSQGCSGLIE